MAKVVFFIAVAISMLIVLINSFQEVNKKPSQKGMTKLDKEIKNDHHAEKQDDHSKLVLHCETLVFSGKSFIKREDYEKLD